MAYSSDWRTSDPYSAKPTKPSSTDEPIKESTLGTEQTHMRDRVKAHLRALADPKLDASDTPEDANLWWRLVHLNPVILRGAIVSIFSILATTGLIVGDKKEEAIVTGIFSFVALVQAVWTKPSVTPNQKVIAYKPDPVDEPTKVVAGPAISTDAIAVTNAAVATPGNLAPPLHIL
jgi:hypothetical protein